MKWRVVGAIFKKEMLETLRDRRAMVLLVLVPILLYPALLLVFTQVATVQSHSLEEMNSRLWFSLEALPEALSERLSEAEELEIIPLSEDGVADLSAAVLRGELDVAIVPREDFRAALDEGATGHVTLLFDAARGRSELARSRVERVLIDYRDAELEHRLRHAEIAPSYVEPIAAEARNVAPPARMGGHMLGHILPILLVLAVVMGAFHPAVDLTAGEKERGTLQTLLTAPISPLVIVAGKFLTVLAIAFVAAAVNVGSMVLVFSHVVTLAGEALEGTTFAFGPGTLGLLFISVVALGLLMSALMMTVAVLARSYKEAQSYLTPIYLLLLVPVMLTQLPGSELTNLAALVPVLNVALLVKELLRGSAGAEAVFLVLVSTVVYTGLTLTLAARLFQREAVLLGIGSPMRAAFGGGALAAGDGRAAPSVGEALALFGVLFVLLFYLGGLLQAWRPLLGLMATLWGVLLLTTLVFIRVRRLDYRATLMLARPPVRSLAAALLLGAGAWVPLLFVVQALQSGLPVPQELFDGMQELFRVPDGALGLLLLFGALALSPAICEELIFRGFLLSAFRRALTPAATIFLSAVLFALLHLSIHRFLGTFALGLLAAWVAYRARSVWPAIVFHAANNGALLVVAVVARAGADGAATPTAEGIGPIPKLFDAQGSPSALAVALGALVALLGALLTRRGRTSSRHNMVARSPGAGTRRRRSFDSARQGGHH